MASCLGESRGAELSKCLHEALAGDSLTAGGLRHAALQACVKGGAGLLCKLLLVVEEVEGAGDDFGGVAASATLGP